MRSHPRLGPILALAALLGLALVPPAAGEVGELPTGAFSIAHELVLPGSPETIYDAVTGDISPWWDHTMSDDPVRLVIEPKPGGGFWEIFDDSGDGVLHATVTYAERGKMLRFVGPLGLAGNAIELVNTYRFEPVGEDSTKLILTVKASGQVLEGWPEMVDQVWHHFLFERLLPYIEKGEP